MKRLLFAFVATALLRGLPTAALAAPADDAKALVDEAIAYIAANGAEKGYEAISAPQGSFVKGETYLFVIDFDGKVFAHGGNPKLVGKSLLELRDADGKPFIQELIDQAKKTSGWVEYKWTNPATKKVQEKTTYVVPIPGRSALIGCGVYK
ncbi:MAG TPA: cache domain-containing protein [Opitutaceae bacterium]|nr:cache domain-containing protein [Opitutaceae bacterium]